MGKRYFCSECGRELLWRRASLKNKAVVIDLIGPHGCDEGHLDNITDSELPSAEAAPEAGSETVEKERKEAFLDARKDMRSGKDVRSTAPHGALSHVKQIPNSIPDKPLEGEK